MSDEKPETDKAPDKKNDQALTEVLPGTNPAQNEAARAASSMAETSDLPPAPNLTDVKSASLPDIKSAGKPKISAANRPKQPGNKWLVPLISLVLVLVSITSYFVYSASHTSRNAPLSKDELVRLERLRRDYGLAIKEGQSSKAIEILTDGLAITPNDAQLLRLRGILYIKKGRKNEGYSDLTKSLAISPGNTDTLMDRAYAYYEDQNYDLALKDYDQLEKSDKPQIKAHGLRGKALVFCAVGHFPQSERLARQSIALDAESAKAWEVLGNCLQEEGDMQGAINSYTAALRLDRSIANIYSNRALAYRKLKQFDNACADMESLVRLEPNEEKYRVRLAKVALDLKRTQLARINLEEAVRLNSSNREARELLRQLEDSQK